MPYELTGTIKTILDIQTFNSGFTKREFVVTTEDRFPQLIKFELVKDKTSLIESFNVGDRVLVNFDLRGAEYNGKYFVNLVAWKIQPDSSGGSGEEFEPRQQTRPQAARGSAPPKSSAPVRQQAQSPDDAVVDDFNDDGIPF